MTTKPFKFGYISSSGEELPHKYNNVWAEEVTKGVERLIIAPSKDHVPLILELCKAMPEPFGVLYVLVVPRSDRSPGRYQSPVPLSHTQLTDFLNRFRKYFESDGRHHLWIGAMDRSFLLVYDKHNVIYAYGPLQTFKEQLQRLGLEKSLEVRFPTPHIHNYNSDFDGDEGAVLDYLTWKFFPLQETDEQ
jgi:hypothetical protein